MLLGWGLRKREFLSEVFLTELNRFVYWFGLPALIFNSLSNMETLPQGTLALFLLFFLAGLGVILLALMVVKVMALPKRQVGAFVQACFRGNLAFIAIPIIQFALSQHPEDIQRESLSLAFFVFAPVMVFYNVFSVVLLVSGQENDGQARIGKMVRTILTNPLILSSGAGLMVFFLPGSLPVFLDATSGYIGSIAGPAALICVGGGMAEKGLRGQFSLSFLASCMKVFCLPGLAWVLSLFISISSEGLFVLLVLSASPAAAAGYVLVKAMKGDEALASSSIVLSTFVSVLPLALIITYFTP